MPANNLPKMPPAPVTDAVLGPLYSRHDLQAYGHTCYLVGIEAARHAINRFPDAWRIFAREPPADQSDENVTFWHGHSEGLKDCASELETALANLDALGRE